MGKSEGLRGIGMNDMCDRTFRFAIRIVRLSQFLGKTPGVGRTISNQILRSGTSIGANVEEGQASQSEADFLTKMSIACKEARETLYWIRLLKASYVVKADRLSDLEQEANELVAILSTICKKLKEKRK